MSKIRQFSKQENKQGDEYSHKAAFHFPLVNSDT